MQQRILITGGLGYIGSHTVVELIEAGFKPIILDDLSNSNLQVLDRIKEITNHKPEFHKIDLKDLNKLNHFFQKNSVDGIIHFAAHKAVGESVSHPLKYYRNNLLGLINLLDAMKQFNVESFIFSSSCTIYGQAKEMPITEKTPLKTPESPYGKTKQMGEEILQDFVNANKSENVISLRYFNPIGAHASAKIGELPIGVPNNLIPFVTQTAKGIREKLYIFGSDYKTPDGTAIRDYIYISDLANAHVLALQRLLDQKNKQNFEAYNLGTGKGSSVLEIVNAFEKANNIKLHFEITERRAGDITSAYADNSLAKKELGWEPKTSIETSLKTAWEWQKSLK